MAEMIGAMGSSIQLASMILNSTGTIYAFFKCFKEAPEDVIAILEELELVHEIMNSLEGESGMHIIMKAKSRFEKVANELGEIANTLSEEMTENKGKKLWNSKRQWARVKTVMQQQTFQDIFAKLERALNLLNLAITVSSMRNMSQQESPLRINGTMSMSPESMRPVQQFSPLESVLPDTGYQYHKVHRRIIPRSPPWSSMGLAVNTHRPVRTLSYDSSRVQGGLGTLHRCHLTNRGVGFLSRTPRVWRVIPLSGPTYR